MAIDKDQSNMAVTAAKAGKNLVLTAVEAAREFLNELVHPNMTIEKIADVASPRLDDLIEENEENGLKYAAGKFKISYIDETHFGLAFEMYFKDSEGKWYKSGGESEPREAELLDEGSWITLQKLKSVEFPITPAVKESEAETSEELPPAEEPKALAEPTSDAVSTVEPELDPIVETKSGGIDLSKKGDIDLEDLLAAKKK